MFLTGFDASILKTLFVDKNLRYHGLIPAYSRTNRILDATKSLGNIVTFRNLEQATIDSVKINALYALIALAANFLFELCTKHWQDVSHHFPFSLHFLHLFPNGNIYPSHNLGLKWLFLCSEFEVVLRGFCCEF